LLGASAIGAQRNISECSAEGERVGLDPRIKKLNLEGVIRDAAALANELVKPRRVGHSAIQVSPVTEECFLKVPEASEKDVDRAICAAREAFDNGPWPRMTPQERSRFVLAIGEEMKKRVPVLSDIWTAQVGAPKSFAGFIINFAPQLFELYGGLGAKGNFTETREMMNGGKALVIREPVGVVAIITPWNALMVLTSFGVAAALTAGCTIVAKPAPETPIEGQLLAECAEAVGLPSLLRPASGCAACRSERKFRRRSNKKLKTERCPAASGNSTFPDVFGTVPRSGPSGPSTRR
jgi:delta 1-pyrroline-5-carboxylate dehydrogenase